MKKIVLFVLLVFGLLPFNVLAQDIPRPTPTEINDTRLTDAQKRMEIAYEQLQEIRKEALVFINQISEIMSRWDWHSEAEFIRHGNQHG